MKKTFFDLLFEHMRENPDIYVLFCGLGYPRYEEFKKEYPDRVFNVEASEQTALDIACGLGVSGKIPFVYSITPFLLWRAAETIRTYIDYEKINVKLIGAGRDEDYGEHDGFSHSATDDYLLMDVFKNICSWWPQDTEDLQQDLSSSIESPFPDYINIKR